MKLRVRVSGIMVFLLAFTGLVAATSITYGCGTPPNGTPLPHMLAPAQEHTAHPPDSPTNDCSPHAHVPKDPPTLKGAITQVNVDTHTLIIKSDHQTYHCTWNDDTSVTVAHHAVKTSIFHPGLKIMILYHPQDGQNVATSITVLPHQFKTGTQPTDRVANQGTTRH